MITGTILPEGVQLSRFRSLHDKMTEALHAYLRHREEDIEIITWTSGAYEVMKIVMYCPDE